MSDPAATSDCPPPGQAADRTTLSWTRTSFAFLANGALLMIKDIHGPVGLTQVMPALLAAAVAMGTYLIALRRQRTLQRRPVPARITARRPVYFIGAAVLVLIAVTTFAQLL